MKWYTGQVSANSEICYNAHNIPADDLLYGYISSHSNRETQLLLARLQASNDIRIHAALDDIRLRVAQFDASKSPEDLHVFMRYLESRLRDISNKNAGSSTTTLNIFVHGFSISMEIWQDVFQSLVNDDHSCLFKLISSATHYLTLLN